MHPSTIPESARPDWYHPGTINGMAMNLRLTEEEDRTLADLAATWQVSKREAAVRAISESAERHGVAEQVEEFADYAMERYRGLLDRLAQ